MDKGSFFWLVSLFWNVAATLWMYWDKRSDKTAEKLRDLEARISQLKADMEKIQATTEAAPTHNDLARVYEAINKTDEKLHRLIGENSEQSKVLNRIHTFLLTGGK